jgi:hypothetical protein
VLVIFIGGLALGSWLCRAIAERMRNPLRLYAMIEARSARRAGVPRDLRGQRPIGRSPRYCRRRASRRALSARRSGCWRGAAAAAVDPAGRDLPAGELRGAALVGEQPGHDIASLYFLNSLGAVLGVLASAFVLIRRVACRARS